MRHAPVLEEDIALANVALDLIGQARLWPHPSRRGRGSGRDADKLAYLRDARAFRNLLLVEQKNGDFAVTMTRQFFRRMALPRLREPPALHRPADRRDRRQGDQGGGLPPGAQPGLDRPLGDGTEESHRRMQKAVDQLWSTPASCSRPTRSTSPDRARRRGRPRGLAPALAGAGRQDAGGGDASTNPTRTPGCNVAASAAAH